MHYYAWEPGESGRYDHVNVFGSRRDLGRFVSEGRGLPLPACEAKLRMCEALKATCGYGSDYMYESVSDLVRLMPIDTVIEDYRALCARCDVEV